MGSSIVSSLRPLVHPMLVHFPIALLFASVALDWFGYWLRRPGFTRAGFYTLALGAAGAGVAALAGPDHVSGDAAQVLLAWHQLFAALTVVLAVGLMAIRFFLVDGLAAGKALAYLAGTVALLAAVSMTGYYGGELTYHQGVGVSAASAGSGSGAAAAFLPLAMPPSVEAKPIVALIGLLCIIALAVWLGAGRSIAPAYYARWWKAVRRVGEQRVSGHADLLWTLHWSTRLQTPPGSSRSADRARDPSDRYRLNGERHEQSVGARRYGPR